jgi:hypothetical protein
VAVGVLGPSALNVTLVLGVLMIAANSRVVRGSTLAVKESTYVEAASVVGASTPRVIVRHILPNVVSPVIVIATVSLGSVILAEGALLHLREEVAHDPEVDVRLEQGAPDLAQPLVQHLFRDDAALAQFLQRTVEPVTQAFEHLPFQASKKRDWKVSIRVSRRRRTARTRSVLSRQV